MQFVTLHLPIINPKTNVRQQRDKVIEEYNEVRKELFAESPHERVLHEMFDQLQAYITLIRQEIAQTALDEREADERTVEYLERAALLHRMKIARYAKERGWL